ncbi:MAG: hypothetical protein GY952_14210 [Rhodobacteraceae bacterium]|nr:hypothetical protein [Paracoccaceae bacterium]
MPKVLNFGTPPHDPKEFQDWVKEAMRELRNLAEESNAFDVFDDFTVSNYTETTTLDASTATAGDIANFIATIVTSMQRRGLRGETGL